MCLQTLLDSGKYNFNMKTKYKLKRDEVACYSSTKNSLLQIQKCVLAMVDVKLTRGDREHIPYVLQDNEIIEAEE